MPQSLPASLRAFSVLALVGSLSLSACGGGSGGITPAPTPGTTPTPGPSANPQSLLCTASGAPQSVARTTAIDSVPKRLMRNARMAEHAPGVIEVTYDRAAFANVRTQASVERTLDFPETGRVVQVLRVDPAQEQATMNRLRSSPYVKSVSFGAYRYLQSTSASSAFTNDPFFDGFSGANVPPLYQNSNVGGQWDNHVVCTANAWAYGDPNTTGRTFPGALGGTAPIAVIDTGADLTHPELVNVTFSEQVLNGAVTVGPVTDNDGHGTDVAGIAAAAGNNHFGFAGVAYAAPLQIYKVFQNPPAGGCPTVNPPAQCTALASDIAIAIGDAVHNGAKVINMSLGDSTPDAAEENAVAAAINAGVVVVAASGNGNSQNVGQPSLVYPAADPGVIAVGASAIDDSNPSSIGEKVASYSNWSGSNPTSWGLVAPGGDPCPGTTGTCNDQDTLHWIENIYTSTAPDSIGTATAPGACRPDPGTTGGNDCRILIAGTSQATPHVAGAVSLLLSVGAQPSQIKTLLCSSATPIAGGKSGCGRLNVYKAMAQAVGDPSP